ncbi:MAG TPA: GDSL-type esterase/lipase family protein [Asticcacaulis sp.]|nr:GDSL-type esterase/lipase family protein [Asticcacaulis sp.]
MKIRHQLSIGLLSAALLATAAHAQDDARPVVDASKFTTEVAANPALPSLYLVGDSTLRPGPSTDGKVGWAERIQPYFDPGKLNVVDVAIAGRSARTFTTEGRWQKVLDVLKPGDVVIIQFGHNDGGVIGDPAFKRRADGKGIGDEVVNDPLPDGTPEQVHTFGWYMAQFVTTGQAKGATVILVSPIPHKQRWQDGRDFANVADWDAQVAKAHNALFFDLTMIVTGAYKTLGPETVETFFADKGTHTTDAGATLNAKCVVAGLKSLPRNPLKPYLTDKANDTAPCVPPA